MQRTSASLQVDASLNTHVHDYYIHVYTTVFMTCWIYNTSQSLYAEKQIIILWNWVFTLKSKMYWVYVVLNWVFVNFILGNWTFPLYFLYKINCFNWVSIISFAFCYPWFHIHVRIPEKQLGKYNKKQLICFFDCTVWCLFTKSSYVLLKVICTVLIQL